MATFRPNPRIFDGKGVMLDMLTITRDGEWVETWGPAIDPTWRGKCPNMHEHNGEDIRATCIEVRLPCDCPLVDEPHDDFDHWACSQCHVEVKPGTYHPGGQWIAGPTRCELRLISEGGTQTWGIGEAMTTRAIAWSEGADEPDIVAALEADDSSCLVSTVWR